MKYKNILLICNGEHPHRKVINYFLKESDLIICADGGANIADKLGIVPDIIIGDMDSINEKAKLNFKTVKKIVKPDQNYTDLEKSLLYISKFNPEIIHVFGAIGNRIDHTLSNLSILKRFKDSGRIIFHTNNSSLEYIDHSIQINVKVGSFFSMIPLSSVNNISTSGLKYELNNDLLAFGIKESQSNIITASPVKITFDSGDMFVIIQKN